MVIYFDNIYNYRLFVVIISRLESIALYEIA